MMTKMTIVKVMMMMMIAVVVVEMEDLFLDEEIHTHIIFARLQT